MTRISRRYIGLEVFAVHSVWYQSKLQTFVLFELFILTTNFIFCMEPKMFSFIVYVSFLYNFTYSSVSTIRSQADFSGSFSPLTLIFRRNIYVYNSEFVIVKKKNYIKGVCIFLDIMVFFYPIPTQILGGNV